MFIDLLILLLSLAFGAMGYLIITFIMKPVTIYLDTRHAVVSDLVFFANVINADMLNEEMKQRFKERQNSNRRHASEFAAAYYDLPKWARKLVRKKTDPLAASRALIGLSNTDDYESADRYVKELKKHLGIDDELDV